ncbi:MAG: complex I subunit 4 family protein [Solirubrobacterales bacterium]
MIQVMLWFPLFAGLVGLVLPRKMVPIWATIASLLVLTLSVIIAIGFDPDVAGLQQVVNEPWIPDLGVRYELGIDGISVFLVVMTALVWAGGILWSAFHQPERARIYFFMLLLAETATLGAFIAQDLLLFVLFFDLMLVPFFFLFGSWGRENEGVKPIPATTKMMVYTLVGSLLMLVGAIAAAILATPEGGQISFSIATLRENLLPEGSQDWIFWFFAAAFLVKMPVFLVHGWMPDAYRVAPLPVLAIFSGVLSKVGAYGFLRVSLPLFPDAAERFQELILIIALASILYGSVMAFTQTNVRLISGYSSVAQLGFIMLGIFSLRPDGADGAVLQMVNHALVVVPMLLIIAVLYERSQTEDLREMGGLAMRAPVLAAMFLIVTLATLAMPGSSNFVGEFFILNGVFQDSAAYTVVAMAGVVLAAFYSLRLYQRTMHNRKPEGYESREISLRDSLVIGPFVVVIIALALYPGLILERGEKSVEAAVCATGPYLDFPGDEPSPGCPDTFVADK